MRGIGSARSAIAFLTPIGGAAAPERAALGWFPVVGAAIGALLGLLWWSSAHGLSAAVAAALVVFADLVLTGMLHLDGLIDSADGLLAPMTKERRLDVMREPTVGAFGVCAAVAFLIMRWAALLSIHPSVLLLTGIWCGSRTVMALAAGRISYARSEGLASAFVPRVQDAEAGNTDGSWTTPVVVAGTVGTAGTVACLILWRTVGGPVALFAGLLASGCVIWLAVRRLGGFTGDVLGAAGVVFETAALIAGSHW